MPGREGEPQFELPNGESVPVHYQPESPATESAESGPTPVEPTPADTVDQLRGQLLDLRRDQASADDIKSVEAEYRQAAASYAKNIIGRLERGEKPEPGELLFLADDVAANAEQSALAEAFLNRQGLGTFQEAMGKLNVKSVRAENLVVQIEKSRAKPWVKEHAKKLLVSGSVSAGTLGVIALLGGPISWAAGAVGVAGGAAGRLGGEWYRQHQLGKERKNGDESYRLNDKVLSDALRQIYLMRTEGQKALEAADDPNARAEAINALLTAASSAEIANIQEYRQLERKASKVKAGLGFVGAVGGSLVSNFLIASHQTAAGLVEAKAHGVRIFHDASGHAHIAGDPSLGHVVKADTEGHWRYVIENKDIQAVMDEVKQKGSWVWRWFETYGGPGHHALSGPDQLKDWHHGAKELLHASSSKNWADTLSQSDIANAVKELSWQTFWRTVGGIAGAAAASEGGFALHEHAQLSEQKLYRDNKPLIDMLEAEAAAARAGISTAAVPERQPAPASQRERLEELARQRGVVLPQTPANISPDWQQRAPDQAREFRLDKLPVWVRLDSNGQRLMVDGQEVYDGILHVDADNNEIVTAHKMPDGSYEYRRGPLDQFLLTHAGPKISLGHQRDGMPALPDRPAGENQPARQEEQPAANPPGRMEYNNHFWEGYLIGGRILMYKETAANNTIRFGVNDQASAVHYGSFRSELAARRASSRIAQIEGIEDYDPEQWLATNQGTNPDADGISAQIRNIVRQVGRRDRPNPATRLPNNPLDGRPIEDQDPVPAPEAAPAPEVGPVAEPEPAPNPEAEPLPFTQEEFDANDAIRPIDNISAHQYNFINRRLPNFVNTQDHLIHYTHVNVAGERITLVNQAGASQEFNLAMIQTLISGLETTRPEDDD